jgi:RimJ/RimL family protein N-acetyltransferase
MAGYWLGQKFWGKGIATEALTQFLALDKSRPLYAIIAKTNRGSARVLEKCGFKVFKEAKSQSRVDNREIDVVTYILSD